MKRSSAVNLVLLPLISPMLFACAEENPHLPSDALADNTAFITGIDRDFGTTVAFVTGSEEKARDGGHVSFIYVPRTHHFAFTAIPSRPITTTARAISVVRPVSIARGGFGATGAGHASAGG